jgi:hypothetical protein
MKIPTNITQLYCRLGCYNKSVKDNVYNLCKCHPNCKTLNFNPKYENKNISNYNMYGHMRKCSCDYRESCKLLK